MDRHERYQKSNFVDRWNRFTKSMDIPDERRVPTPENLRWFLRTGHIKNMNNKNYYFAIEIAKEHS